MKQKQLLFILVGAIVLMLGGQLSTPIQRTSLQEQIAEKQRRGYSVKFLDNTLVELTEPMTGAKRQWSMETPSDQDIRAWASERGIPIMEVDPRTIDTTRFANWFRYAGRVPIGFGDKIVLGDVDDNSRVEVYGFSRGFTSEGELAIHEATTESTSTNRYTFQPYPGNPIGLTDIDRDSRMEFAVINSTGTTTISFFQQPSRNELPIQFRFSFPTAVRGGETTKFTPLFGYFDQDSLMDCLFKTNDPDSVGRKIAIAEYDSLNRQLVRTWDYPGGFFGEFAQGDFDQDGRNEFATTTGFLGSKLYVFENAGDNDFRVSYRDSTPFANNYRIAAGDVDGDGKPEIFAEANMETDWVLVEEADSDDQFSPNLLIHFSTSSGFNFPAYFALDIDGDGRKELALTTGPYILIMKGNGDNRYAMWYARYEPGVFGIQFPDLNRDRRLDLALSFAQVDTSGTRLNYFTTFYQNSRTTSVAEQRSQEGTPELLASYPNPANPSTTIEYRIPTSLQVRILLFDVLGRKVREVAEGYQERGLHKIKLNTNGLSSGIYFYRLQAGSSHITRKLILAR
jgi:hypothetical protein